MKNILITGAKGIIGKILSRGLSNEYQLTLADLPQMDVRKYNQILRALSGKDAVIHLAWNAKTENFQKGYDPDNSLMFSNVYKAALESKVPRVIMASSVHADDFRNYKINKFLTTNRIPTPLSPYGADKIFMESLGKYYSKKGLEVVCIRFGAVGDKPPKDKEGIKIWLSAKDCVSLTKKIIEAKTIPNNFSIIYGISNNKNKIHSFENPFGWKPQSDSSNY